MIRRMDTDTIDKETTKPVLELNREEGLVEDTIPWYAIKLFSMRQNEVKRAFEENLIPTFIPMQMVDFEDSNHVRHELRPVVKNLIFVKKTLEEPDMRHFIANLDYKLSVITKSRTDRTYYEIPAKQMFEFQAMCNPGILMRKFLTAEQAKLKPGTPVQVKYGPLKGLTGRLVRSNKKYYLLKEIPCLGVMLKVSRWCCVPLEPQSK